MIQVTIGPKRLTPNDPLGRAYCGYEPGMSQDEMYEANRGCWVLGEYADAEHYALFVADGVVQQAVEIDALTPVPGTRRRVIEGKEDSHGRRWLTKGHPVHDQFVGKPALVNNRNPIAYVDHPVAHVPCRCGCGNRTGRGDFLPGHDQTALHARVAQVGTVTEFIDWFDAAWGRKSG